VFLFIIADLFHGYNKLIPLGGRSFLLFLHHPELVEILARKFAAFIYNRADQATPLG
jgi:hypothetical protein